MTKIKLILAIETSCDETAVSIVKFSGDLSQPRFAVLAEEIASQTKLHAKWGGVVPNLAKREHEKNLPILLERVLTKLTAKSYKPRAIDAIAVTVGPGLEPALWVGVNFARALSLAWSKPLIPVNHLAGHIYSPLAQSPRRDLNNLSSRSRLKMRFPVLALIVSGGHTELVLVKDWYKHRVIGQTRDDAAGEAFDKVARLLGLPYPGGPALAKLASSYRLLATSFKLPRPMIDSPNFDFSFSGLKTAVRYLLEVRPLNSQGLTSGAVAREFQNAVVDVLSEKTRRAIEKYSPATLIVAGGVSANRALRERMEKLAKAKGVRLLLPTTTHSLDNATMIAVAGALLAQASPKSLKKPGAKLTAKGRLAI